MDGGASKVQQHPIWTEVDPKLDSVLPGGGSSKLDGGALLLTISWDVNSCEKTFFMLAIFTVLLFMFLSHVGPCSDVNRWRDSQLRLLHFDGVVCLLTGSQCGMDSCGSNCGNLASTASGFEHTVTSQLLRERECCALSLIADSVVGQLL